MQREYESQIKCQKSGRSYNTVEIGRLRHSQDRFSSAGGLACPLIAKVATYSRSGKKRGRVIKAMPSAMGSTRSEFVKEVLEVFDYLHFDLYRYPFFEYEFEQKNHFVVDG